MVLLLRIGNLALKSRARTWTCFQPWDARKAAGRTAVRVVVKGPMENEEALPSLTRALCPEHIPESVLTAARTSSGFLVPISLKSRFRPLFWNIRSAPASSRPRTMRLLAAWFGRERKRRRTRDIGGRRLLRDGKVGLLEKSPCKLTFSRRTDGGPCKRLLKKDFSLNYMQQINRHGHFCTLENCHGRIWSICS